MAAPLNLPPIRSDLAPELRIRVESAAVAVGVVLDAASRLHHDDSDAQLHALGLHATIIELFSECLLLASQGAPNSIPIVLRAVYEALIDLDNLLRDASYVQYLVAANLKQMIKLMTAAPLQELRDKHQAEYNSFVKQLGELKGQGIKPLLVSERCQRAGRTDEYNSLYGLFCLDTHNNGAALADRHMSERSDGSVRIDIFGPYEAPPMVIRLDFGLQFLLQSARMTHGAFNVRAPEIDRIAAQLEAERIKARSDSTRTCDPGLR